MEFQKYNVKEKKKKKKYKMAKWLSEEVIQVAEKRRQAKGKGEKERYIDLHAELHSPSKNRKER